MSSGQWDLPEHGPLPQARNFKALGWCHIVLGVLYIPIAFLIKVATRGFIEFVNAVVAFLGEFLQNCASGGRGPKPEPWLNEAYLTGTLFPLIVTVAVALTILGILGGIGLMRLRAWGRISALIASVFILPLFPVGTVFGIYNLVVLMRAENSILFR